VADIMKINENQLYVKQTGLLLSSGRQNLASLLKLIIRGRKTAIRFTPKTDIGYIV
jgi:hypothetical protein